MLEFHKLKLDDIEKVRSYFNYSVNRICDNTVGGAFMWRDYFSVEYAVYNNTVIYMAKIKYHSNITAFSLPLGDDPLGSIDKIVEYCTLNSLPVAFCTVTEEDIKILEKRFKHFELYKETNWSDYIYKAADLTSLSGRRYSGQRNHINNFKKIYDTYAFEEITNENLDQVRDFYTGLSSGITFTSEIAVEEHKMTVEVLNNFNTYNLPGGLIRANGDIAAFSIGEINGNVLFIHIEKADTSYRGAYQMINREFAGHYTVEGIEYINREEDVGDEGLRISKLSYHPHEVVDKYILLVI